MCISHVASYYFIFFTFLLILLGLYLRLGLTETALAFLETCNRFEKLFF
jgi:hypothetical protein